MVAGARALSSRQLWVGAVVCLTASTALAQGGRAQRLFDEGLEEMLAGRFEAGCSKIAESLRVEFAPGTLFTLAECRAKQGKIATAIDRYSEFISLWNTLPPAVQEKQRARLEVSNQERNALLAAVPTIKLLLPKWAPADTVVMKNGVVLGNDLLGQAIKVDPGEHIFVTQAPGEPVTERRTHIARGQHLTMMLPVNVSADGKRPTAPAHDEPATVSPADRVTPTTTVVSGDAAQEPPALAYTTAAIGATGIAVGSVAGLLAWSNRSTILEKCENHVCTAEGKNAADNGQLLGLVSTVGFTVGLASLATSAVLFMTHEPDDARKASTQPWVGAGSRGGALVGATGRF